MNTDAFIKFSNKADSIEKLVKLFHMALMAYGYSKYVCFTVEGPEVDIVFSHGGGQYHNMEFIQQYVQLHFVKSDPIYTLLMSVCTPFTWDQVMRLPLTTQQKALMQLQRRYGIIKGLGIPIRSNDKSIIGISIVSEQLGPRTDPNAVSELFAIARQFSLRRTEITRKMPLLLPLFDQPSLISGLRYPMLQLAY